MTGPQLLAIAAAAVLVVIVVALLLPWGRGRSSRANWLVASSGAVLVGLVGGAAVPLAAEWLWAPTPHVNSEGEALLGATLGVAICVGLLGLVRRTTVWRKRVSVLVLPSAILAAVVLAPLSESHPGPVVSASGVVAPSGHPRAAPPLWRLTVVQTGPGYRHFPRWEVPVMPAGFSSPISGWRAPMGLSTIGRVGSTVIPATRSHFGARPALVYLPPAALAPHPPKLPVVIALTGQSRGSGPPDVVFSGRITSILDSIAAQHHGIAPIVVIPDQLGPAYGNPMCLDSPLGNVATYLTVDVRNWVIGHLPVQADSRDWTVAGFSEGGTCSIQLAAERPDIFGSLVDVSGEPAPIYGSLAHTLFVAFHGSLAAYGRAEPINILASHAPYLQTRAYFAAGANDRLHGFASPLLAAAARRAGMRTSLWMIPGVAHNWRVGSRGLDWGLHALTDWWHL